MSKNMLFVCTENAGSIDKITSPLLSNDMTDLDTAHPKEKNIQDIRVRDKIRAEVANLIRTPEAVS